MNKRSIFLTAMLVFVIVPSTVFGMTIPDSWVRSPQFQGTVTYVYDGDTIKVQKPDGSTMDVRLIGIDTPETHGSNNPDEFERILDNARGRACLKRYGERAKKVLKRTLTGENVTVYAGQQNDTSGYYDRFLGYVVYNGGLINQKLVENGFARIYSPDFAGYNVFKPIESAAQSNQTGLWNCRSE